jgi:hypothetical protein
MKLRAVLVDPVARTVTDIEIEKGLDGMYEAIGCELVALVRLKDGSEGDLWVDDEGLLKLTPESRFFVIHKSSALTGKGLILGSTEEGESTHAPQKADYYAPLITFMGPSAARVYMDMNFSPAAFWRG